MRRGDIHKIHVRIGDKLLIRSVRHRKTVFRRESRRALAVTRRDGIGGDQIAVAIVLRHSHQRIRHVLCDTTRTENLLVLNCLFATLQ